MGSKLATRNVFRGRDLRTYSVAGSKMIMIEAYLNLASHNFSGRDVANYQNHLAIVLSSRNPNWSQEIRHLFIRGYHCLIDRLSWIFNDVLQI